MRHDLYRHSLAGLFLLFSQLSLAETVPAPAPANSAQIIEAEALIARLQGAYEKNDVAGFCRVYIDDPQLANYLKRVCEQQNNRSSRRAQPVDTAVQCAPEKITAALGELKTRCEQAPREQHKAILEQSRRTLELIKTEGL